MDRIENYQIIRELGRNREGGRISYLAESIDSKQKVVIKQFRFVQENASWQGFKTYQREIEILQEINHPRIPQYFDSFETEDGFCMVQEYKDAPSLATRSSFTPQEIQQITVSILEILVDLQQRLPPIIHRDIKPENILVDEEDNAYLIDFGLARIHNQDMAMSSVIAGTPGFMPPEELFNRPLTKASDLYSVGATAIALITKTPPSKLSNLIDDNYQFQFAHLLSGINPDFIDWLKKMVAPNLKDRFANAKDALAGLKAIDITGISAFKIPDKQVNHNNIAIALTSITAAILTIISIAIALKPPSKTTVTKQVTVTKTPTKPVKSNLTPEQQWFKSIKSRCNAVEVVTAMRNTSYPKTQTGVGYAASCYALAGRIDLADKIIQELPTRQQVYAAEVVFNIGHPVADAGDDRSAGPIMDLVLRYWSENYMALYHGGMSAYVLDDYPKAKKHLEEFLRIYQRQDYWTNKAKNALSRMEQNIPADESFSVHH
ncbi:serine/threonine protein kinase [Waterburya agarophytonicola K14]|uniref:non-specific serine/threonine protein kinase n=1 Tax=Waterburya agarophytonicola KI4 TaxID=2874699 RepID=A0A964FEL2_9CYAN|nr:serine/threonine-protein kinase [Waterburya agarophytonicola]MCC0176022.1 serine/threonine protein kinase [Waterburya agarophytonicola KI4]